MDGMDDMGEVIANRLNRYLAMESGLVSLLEKDPESTHLKNALSKIRVCIEIAKGHLNGTN